MKSVKRIKIYCMILLFAVMALAIFVSCTDEVATNFSALDLSAATVCVPSSGSDKYDGHYQLNAAFKAQNIVQTSVILKFSIINGKTQNAWADINAGNFGKVKGNQNIKSSQLDLSSGKFRIETTNGSGRATADGHLYFESGKIKFKGTYEGSDPRGKSGKHSIVGGRYKLLTLAQFKRGDFNGTYYVRAQENENIVRARITLDNGSFKDLVYLDGAKEITSVVLPNPSCFDDFGNFYFISRAGEATNLRYEGSIKKIQKETDTSKDTEASFRIDGISYSFDGKDKSNEQSFYAIPWDARMRFDGEYKTQKMEISDVVSFDDIWATESGYKGTFYLRFAIFDGQVQDVVGVFGKGGLYVITAKGSVVELISHTPLPYTPLVLNQDSYTSDLHIEDGERFAILDKKTLSDDGTISITLETGGSDLLDTDKMYEWKLEGRIKDSGFEGSKFSLESPLHNYYYPAREGVTSTTNIQDYITATLIK